MKVGDNVKHRGCDAVITDELVNDKSRVVVQFRVTKSSIIAERSELRKVNYKYKVCHTKNGYFICRDEIENGSCRRVEYLSYNNRRWQEDCEGCYSKNLPMLVKCFKSLMGKDANLMIDMYIFDVLSETY